MKDYTTNKRYCPHEIATKLHSVQTYRQTGDISYVCRKYKALIFKKSVAFFEIIMYNVIVNVILSIYERIEHV